MSLLTCNIVLLHLKNILFAGSKYTRWSYMLEGGTKGKRNPMSKTIVDRIRLCLNQAFYANAQMRKTGFVEVS